MWWWSCAYCVEPGRVGFIALSRFLQQLMIYTDSSRWTQRPSLNVHVTGYEYLNSPCGGKLTMYIGYTQHNGIVQKAQLAVSVCVSVCSVSMCRQSNHMMQQLYTWSVHVYKQHLGLVTGWSKDACDHIPPAVCSHSRTHIMWVEYCDSTSKYSTCHTHSHAGSGVKTPFMAGYRGFLQTH